MSAPATPTFIKDPYVGPNPLAFRDPIFGRDEEIDDLLDQLIADRIVLLHSPSGCGKTSLIEAGLRPRLPDRRFLPLPSIRVGRPDLVTPCDPDNPLMRSVFQHLEKPSVESGIRLNWPPRAPDMSLVQFLDQRAQDTKELESKVYEFIIVDQFEEALTLTCSEEFRLAFFKELAAVLVNPNRWALFSIREDYLGPLEPYLPLLPMQLSSRFRLTLLKAKPNAELAIRGPAEAVGVVFEERAAERLAESLAEIRVPAPGGGSTTIRPGSEVEPVQLQVVCSHIWRQKVAEEARHGRTPTIITSDDLHLESPSSTFGGTVEQALGAYYDTRVHHVAGNDADLERQIREWFEGELITREGFRRPVAAGSSALNEETIQGLVDAYLVRKDIRGSATWFELCHDRLVPAIRHQNRTWFSDHLQTWQTRAREWDESGRQKYLLILGDDLEKAQAWRVANPDRIADLDEEFLQASDEEEKSLQNFKIWRKRFKRILVVSAAVSVIATIIAITLSWKGSEKAQQVQELRKQYGGLETNLHEIRQALVAAEADKKTAGENQRKLQSEIASQQQTVDRLASEKRSLQSERKGLEDEKKQLFIVNQELRGHMREDQKKYSELQQGLDKQNRQLGEIQKQNADQDAKLTSVKLTLEAAQAPSQRAVVIAAQAIDTLASTKGTGPSADDLNRALAALEAAFSRSLQDPQEIPVSQGNSVISLSSAEKGKCVTVATLGITAGTKAGEIRAYSVGQEGHDCSKLGGTSKLDVWATSADFASSKDTVAIGLYNGQVALLSSGQNKARSIEPLRHQVVSVAISSDARYLVAASSLWNFAVWDLDPNQDGTGKPKQLYVAPDLMRRFKRLLRGETELVKGIALFQSSENPLLHGGYVAIASEDGSVSVYGIRTSRQIMRIPGPYEGGAKKDRGHLSSALAVAFSPDGKSLVSKGNDRTARVWDLSGTEQSWGTPEGIQELVKGQAILTGCPGAVTRVAVSPDNEIVATGCSDGRIRLYDLVEVRRQQQDLSAADRHIEAVEEMTGHPGNILQLHFDSARRMLISSSADPKIRIWRIPQLNDLQQRKQVRTKIELLLRSTQSGTSDKNNPLTQKDLDDLKELIPQTRAAAKLGSLDQKW